MRRNERLHPLEALHILGLSDKLDLTEKDVLSAFRKMCMQTHPDKGGDPAKFASVVAAKDSIMEDFVHAKSFVNVKPQNSTIGVNWPETFTSNCWKPNVYKKQKA